MAQPVRSSSEQAYWELNDVTEPPRYLPSADEPLSQLLTLGRLQVIVKLSTIHLTPSHLIYPDGAWHIEGMRMNASSQVAYGTSRRRTLLNRN